MSDVQKIALTADVPPKDPAADAKPPEAGDVRDLGGVIRVTPPPAPVAEEKPKAGEQQKAERPAWLPEEFESPEAFAEAWKTSKSGKPAEEKKPAEQVDPSKAAETAGLDMATLTREYAEKGELSAESLSKLEKAGISKTVVDAHIEGLKAQAAQRDARMADSVGGKDELAATLKWAEGALSADEIAAANAALAGPEAQARLVLTGLHSRRLAEVGREPTLVAGRSTPARSSVEPYASSAEMIADMRNPKYQNDPAFRDRVMKRVEAMQA